MKLISWKEKYPTRKRDAEDFLFIMNKYDEAGNSTLNGLAISPP
jgi:predicted nucleotidyltransferase